MNDTPLPFQWCKLGHVFVAGGQHSWMKHFAQVPTPILLEDRIRIFFTCRPDPESDGSFVSATTYLDLDVADPTKILYLHDRPVMPLGDMGTFDQFGVMPCCTRRQGEELWLYYVGWARTRGVPWQSSVGLAISRDDGVTFERYARGPIITRTPEEPFVHGSPYVVETSDGMHLWYLSGTSWMEGGGRIESIYRLMHAVSKDGIHWERNGQECIPALTDDECQARPVVLLHQGKAHMWFSYRHGLDFRNPERGYGIGYASSTDLITWQRDDSLAGIGKSESGWDSEMVSYPSLLRVGDRLLMFYCGNQMGRAGFGVAVTNIA
jgi:hypothetical protein